MMNKRSYNFLDMLSILSFTMQLINQQQLLTLSDMKRSNNQMLTEIHRHLQEQDEKLNKILEYLHETD